ncbi:MAG: hypothetical protein R6V67_00870, partial [Spirochaetia bacterium]
STTEGSTGWLIKWPMRYRSRIKRKRGSKKRLSDDYAGSPEKQRFSHPLVRTVPRSAGGRDMRCRELWGRWDFLRG